MIYLPFALSLSSTFTKIGAIGAFAALVGIAILSLLVFSQARELKRLREWAGRAPERAAELEQRVSAAASARVQQQVPGAPAASPVPRAAPIQARAVAAGAAPATRVVATPLHPGAGAPTAQPLTASGAPVAPPAPVAPGAPPVPGVPPQPARPAAPANAPKLPAPTPAASPVGAPASAAGAAQSRPVGASASPPGLAAPGSPAPPAPATAAAASGMAASAAPPRAPSPPRPPAPQAQPPAQPPAPRAAPVPAAPPPPAPPIAPAPSAPAPPLRPPVSQTPPVSPPPPVMPRPPAPPATVAAAVEGRSVYAAKRSPRRVAALVAVALIVVAAAAAVAVTALGGSSKDKAQTAAAKTATTPGGAHAKRSAHKAAPKAPTVSPAETTVTVLNATEAEGLAHRTASELQQNGYSEATAMNGKPPGSGLLSVVEYASGHKAEAEGVARSAEVTHVEPIEAAVTALAGSANVVVIVGADKDKEASEASSP